ncbi:hypothetical protein D9615_004867 [Tricholomella constricta]|uniref:Six-hairpin glycosidase n=1 Tax=Tricholomella constricta TaxID=117010 RepID=A0A8H5M754_9AGAR|nr:hypothetical protein D9615_004867 [Tricholomella constricta]
MRALICKARANILALLTLFLPWSSASLIGSKRGKADHDAIPFSPGFPVQKVVDLAQTISSHSWEFGTATEALLELYDPELSVFGDEPFEAAESLSEAKPQKKGNRGTQANKLPRALAYAAEKIVIGTGANALADGDGAVGDPASLGVGAVLLGKRPGFEKYAKAAAETVEYITQDAPRALNGAISHRVDVVELWADFIYMAPPFLAYYAADTANITLLRESVSQCRLYRDRVQAKSDSPEPPFKGLWQHIQGPQHDDPGLWSTGNAWVAAGMARVLATVLKAPLGKGNADLKWRGEAVAELTTWIEEIVNGAVEAGKDAYEDGLVKNYFDKPETFGETSGSALMAATVYRMVILRPGVFGRSGRYIRWADGIRTTLGGEFFDDISEDTLDHVDAVNGTVRPTVNPLGWGDVEPWMTGSPEGQSFVVLLYAAWRDCVLARVCERD